MLINVTLNPHDVLQQIKLSCQLPSLIEGIVNRRIITSIASEKGLCLEANELQLVADKFRIVNDLKSAEKTWFWLKKHGLSLEDFEELIHTTTLSAKLAQHLFADKVEPYFVEHQLDYAQVIMYEVVIDDEDVAMELYYSILEEEISFFEVAHQSIRDVELRRSGGYRGKLTRSDLRPEISTAVFAARPPQLLQPIETSKGVHLIFVEEILQPQLDDALSSKILADLFSAWLKEQSEQVEVVDTACFVVSEK